MECMNDEQRQVSSYFRIVFPLPPPFPLAPSPPIYLALSPAAHLTDFLVLSCSPVHCVTQNIEVFLLSSLNSLTSVTVVAVT